MSILVAVWAGASLTIDFCSLVARSWSWSLAVCRCQDPYHVLEKKHIYCEAKYVPNFECMQRVKSVTLSCSLKFGGGRLLPANTRTHSHTHTLSR
ncbi:hypothetical protein V8C34DRAFT_291503 [Trichoderma compactum]